MKNLTEHTLRSNSSSRMAQFLIMASLSFMANADELVTSPSVEENLRAMDTDRNGLVTVTEVRAYLEAKHGKGYEKALLDKLEQTSGASCGTAFANSFY